MERRQLEQLAAANAQGRIAIGAGLLAAPGLVARAWVGETGPAARTLARALGIRDLVLGGGLQHSLSTGRPARDWLIASAAADAVDAVATLLAWRSLPRTGRALTLAIASVSAVQNAAVASRMEP